MNELTKEDLDTMERRDRWALAAKVIVSLVAIVWVFVTLPLSPALSRTGDLAEAVGESKSLKYTLYAANELGLDVTLVDADTSSDVTLEATYYAGRYTVAGIDGTTVYVYNLFNMTASTLVHLIVLVFAATILGCAFGRYENEHYGRLLYESQLERRNEMNGGAHE